MKTITINPLSEKSIADAIQEIKKFRRNIDDRANKLSKMLAEIGLDEAIVRFGYAFTDETVNDTEVHIEEIKNGYKIIASGNQTWFIEFGAGVYYNGVEPYPDRPDAVAKIGEYGKGKGKRKMWGYYDDAGVLHLTHGIPSAMPMYHANKEMRRRIKEIAEEVFTDDRS